MSSGTWMNSSVVLKACEECLKHILELREAKAEEFLKGKTYSVWSWDGWWPKCQTFPITTKEEYLKHTSDSWAPLVWHNEVVWYGNQEAVAKRLHSQSLMTDKIFVSNKDFWAIDSYFTPYEN